GKGKDGEKEREEEEGFSLAAYTSATERYLANPTRENEAERDRLAELLRREILLRQGQGRGQGKESAAPHGLSRFIGLSPDDNAIDPEF
ncbi:hypothetical protein EKO27_g12113, partial [Xylaria grammica]